LIELHGYPRSKDIVAFLVPDPVGIVTVVLPIVVPELEAVTVKLFCVVHSLLYVILTSTLSAEVPEEAPLQGLPSA
jgi:hypothetical protein